MPSRWSQRVFHASLSSLVAFAVGAGCGDSSSPASDAGAGSDAGAKADADASTGGAGTWCEVASILEAKCQTCHADPVKFGAPMALVSYDDTQADAVLSAGKTVVEAISARIHDDKKPMPPASSPALSAGERATLDAWIAAGAPKAESACSDDGPAPTVPPKADDWPTDCDRTVKLLAHADGDLAAKYPVPANTQEYKTLIFDAPWDTDDVQAVAFRPITDNSKVLHHWILYKNNRGNPGVFLNGWAPGGEGGTLPSDVGVIMPKGPQSLLLQVHYWNAAADSTVEPDASGVEVCLMGKAHFRKNSAEVFQGFSSFLFSINRGELNKDVVSDCHVTSSEPVHLLTSSPHMHTLGRHAKLVLKRADGTTKVLHDAPFDFEEQRSAAYAEEIVINKGDTVTTTCTYSFPQDDTTHMRNGALLSTVRFGEFTEDEMCYNFALYYPAGALGCSFL